MTRPEKIMHLKRQIHVWNLQHKLVRNKVYYDQLGEMQYALQKLERAERDARADPLTEHCAENPSDLECREYDV